MLTSKLTTGWRQGGNHDDAQEITVIYRYTLAVIFKISLLRAQVQKLSIT